MSNSFASPLDEIISISQHLESILSDEWGAEGKGLHEKISSIQDKIPENIVRGIRYIATIRNKAVHEDIAIANKELSNIRDRSQRVLEQLNSLAMESKRVSSFRPELRTVEPRPISMQPVEPISTRPVPNEPKVTSLASKLRRVILWLLKWIWIIVFFLFRVLVFVGVAIPIFLVIYGIERLAKKVENIHIGKDFLKVCWTYWVFNSLFVGKKRNFSNRT